MKKTKHLGVRLDEKTINRLDTLSNARQQSASETIRQLVNGGFNTITESVDNFDRQLSTRCSDLSAGILQLKTATNLTTAETFETRQHVGKISELLSSKVLNIETDIKKINIDIQRVAGLIGTIFQKLGDKK